MFELLVGLFVDSTMCRLQKTYWKRIHCEHCQTWFFYLRKLKVTGRVNSNFSGNPEAKAEERAKARMTELEAMDHPVPCPECGKMQHTMLLLMREETTDAYAAGIWPLILFGGCAIGIGALFALLSSEIGIAIGCMVLGGLLLLGAFGCRIMNRKITQLPAEASVFRSYYSKNKDQGIRAGVLIALIKEEYDKASKQLEEPEKVYNVEKLIEQKKDYELSLENLRGQFTAEEIDEVMEQARPHLLSNNPPPAKS